MKLREKRNGAIRGADPDHPDLSNEEIISVVNEDVEVPRNSGDVSKFKKNEKMLRVYTETALRTDGGLFFSVNPKMSLKMMRSPCS